jgi:hypothetical protein
MPAINDSYTGRPTKSTPSAEVYDGSTGDIHTEYGVIANGPAPTGSSARVFSQGLTGENVRTRTTYVSTALICSAGFSNRAVGVSVTLLYSSGVGRGPGLSGLIPANRTVDHGGNFPA